MKKKLFALTVTLLGGFAMVLPNACAAPQNEPVEEVFNDPISYQESKPVSFDDFAYRAEEETFISPKKVILHYHNDDNKCLDRRFYCWVTGIDGLERKPNYGEWTATDMTIELDFNEIPEYDGALSLFFIIKVAGTWAGQSEDTELKYELYQENIKLHGDYLEVWTVPGEGTSIEIYNTEDETKFPKVTTAKFVDFKSIYCTSTIDKDKNGNVIKSWVATSYKLYAYDKDYLESSEEAQKANKEFHLFKQGKPSGNTFTINFNYTAKINVQYVLETIFPGYEDRTARIVVSCENLYSDARFEQYYTYDGDDLGVTYTPTSTTFKVWSPVSALVKLNVYNTGTPKSLGGSDAARRYSMNYVKGGVWELTVKGDLKGKYYTYSFTHSQGTVEAMDPYAKACGINGLRGYVYDKSSTDANPENWDSLPLKWDKEPGYDISSPQELTIYEVQIRDLTMDETWISRNGNQRGTYNAFCESGTTYTEGGKTVTTGYDHIRDLGVKAIQLLPVFDHDDDERPEKMKFNWGYNPLNYNCVEGGYSTDAYNPLARIKEYKNLIYQYSQNGNHTRVIMDVVYNHVSSAASSCFTKAMPKYYFRYDENWAYLDGSGCNNEVKTDATMMRKYIVDSLVWWATEYKVKGFRFDLMGLIDTLTMKAAKEALYAIDPDIYVYGEGWTSGGYHGRYEEISIDDPDHNQGKFQIGGSENSLIYSQLYETSRSKGVVGGFNNAGRDNLKGSNDDGYNGCPYPQFGFIAPRGDLGSTAYVGGKTGEVANMLKGINSWAPGANPLQTISYASCHDNYTLWDQLRFALAPSGYYTIDKDDRKIALVPNGDVEPAASDLVHASLATHATVFAANTASFIQGGEELYRSKTYTAEELANYYDGTVNAENIVRPFSTGQDYVHYSPDPDVVQATSEVWMYGKVTSHNSYKAPDSINSFKWDRKISVDGFDTYQYNDTWAAIIKEHSKMSKVSYPDNLDTPKFNIWNADYDSNAFGLWNGSADGSSGYYFFIANGNGGNVGVGDLGSCEIIASYGYTNHGSSAYVELSSFGFVLAKKG